MEFHYGSSEGSEASIEALPHGYSHLHESMIGRIHKKD